MTYTELVAAFTEYTENYEQTFVDNIPVFLRQTETRVYNTVQVPALRANKTGILSANNKYLSAPGDFLAVYSLAVIENYGTANEVYHYLLNKDVNYIREAYPTPADTGLPLYYAIFGPSVSSNVVTDELTFILGPTPDAAYYAELHYYYYPESITTAADGRTWLGDNYDPVLLYGALREAYLFMKGEQDVIANVEAKYNEAMGQLKRLGDGMERQDAYRSGQTRVRVT
jgi:hypothetical protein